MKQSNLFLAFIRYTLNSDQLRPDCGRLDWKAFYDFCLRQGIVGLVFDGIERSGMHVPKGVLFKWIGTVESIKANNKLLDKRCCQISHFWGKRGYYSCILKGQANATMYPKPELRSPGDIDIWVSRKDDGRVMTDNNAVAEIIRIAQAKAPDGHYSLHHVTMPVFNDTSVEVHYRPVFLDNWWKDKKLQRYIDGVKDAQFTNKVILNNSKTEICGLTDEFNAVFQMLHMWHHLLSTRNNFKQLIDYYYLLNKGFPKCQRENIAQKFKEFGVYKYAQGIMWIEHRILGLEASNFLVYPDEEIGRLLLRETIHYGEKPEENLSRLRILWNRVTGNLSLFRQFPSPVVIAPIYLVWHQWWKLKMKYRLQHTIPSESLDELSNLNT